MSTLKHKAAAVATLSFAAITGCAHRTATSSEPPAPPALMPCPVDQTTVDKQHHEPQVDMTFHPPCIAAPQ